MTLPPGAASPGAGVSRFVRARASGLAERFTPGAPPNAPFSRPQSPSALAPRGCRHRASPQAPARGATSSGERNPAGYDSQKPSRRNPRGFRLFRPCFRGFAAPAASTPPALVADQRVPSPTRLRRRGQLPPLLSVLRGERDRERSTAPAKRSPASQVFLRSSGLRRGRGIHPDGRTPRQLPEDVRRAVGDHSPVLYGPQP
jgi:hypothetical protein